MAGFTFVGREPEIAGFRELMERPEGELLLITGPPGTGKSHLLRRLRREAESTGRHFVQINDLAFLPDSALRIYSIVTAMGVRQTGEESAAKGPELLPNPHAFIENLISEDTRPPCDKLLQTFSAASAHLPDSSRLVLLLDLGPLADEEAFPLEFLARRLPRKVKLVAAAREAPPGVAALANATIVSGLPPLGEGEVARLLDFHLPKGTENAKLAAPVAAKFGGHALATDVAIKLLAGSPAPAEALAALPTEPQGLCRRLMGKLEGPRRDFALCLARVPSGVDTAALRALTPFNDSDLRRLLRSEAIRNVVATQREARGPRAQLAHKLLVDELLAGSTEGAKDFHARAAAYFLGVVGRDPYDVDALSAHAYHLRLSGDKRQFIADFPRTYKVKHSFHLLHHLADEYSRLIEYCDELKVAGINRPACLANLGRVHQELDQNNDALRCFRAALEDYERQDDAAGKAEQLANIASVLQDLGQLDEAREYLERAATLDESAGNQAALAADLNNLGILCQQLDQLDRALDYHQRALKLHQSVDNDVGVANQLANLAAIHRKRGDLQAAREAYQKAWQIDSRSKSHVAEIADLCNLGLVFQDLGDMEKAITCTQQAIELDRALADRKGEATHLCTLAAMHQKLAQYDDAARALEQAIEVDRSIGNAEGEAAARRAAENLERLRRGEALGDETQEADQGPVEQQKIQREPAGENPWGNLQLVDERPFASGPAAEAEGLAAQTDPEEQPESLLALGSEVIEALRRERDEARRRAAELEAELETYRKVVENLRRIVGQSDGSD